MNENDVRGSIVGERLELTIVKATDFDDGQEAFVTRLGLPFGKELVESLRGRADLAIQYDVAAHF